MAGEKKIENSEAVAAILESDNWGKLAGQDVASGKDGTLSILTSSTSSAGDDATSSVKRETGQGSVAKQGYSQLGDQDYPKAGGATYAALQSENGSLLYYLPGYNPYATRSFTSGHRRQPYHTSPGYPRRPVSYRSEAMPGYSWDSAYVGDAANETSGFPGKSRSARGYNVSVESNSLNSIKSSGTLNSKYSTLPLDLKSRKYATSSNISECTLDSQPLKTVGKLGSGYQSASLVNGFRPAGKFSSGFLMHNSPMNYRPNGRVWNENNKINLRDRNRDFDASTELTRGPRVQNGCNSSDPSEGEPLGLTIRRDHYNLEEFQTEYSSAKFYVIKSYSEDDVYKCIKFDVWSSTPNGNTKLSAAFRDAEAKASETGTRCPVFLFYSVNASGQFVGVAEMCGPVDFNKDMDFWQLDKWNGFFPVKWHVIKDVPHAQLRHIILENNDNRPVTFTRDTQEIGLKQGIEMLNIFKSYPAKTSILDDVNFYENREKSIIKARSSKQAEMSTDHDFPMQFYSDGGTTEEAVRRSDCSDPRKSDCSDPTTSALSSLVKNLSLNSHPQKSGAVIKPSEKRLLRN